MAGKSGRDMAIRIGWNDLHVLLVAEGVSWSPDVADDMVARIRPLWQGALQDFKDLGFLSEDDDYLDEYDEEFEEEGVEDNG